MCLVRKIALKIAASLCAYYGFFLFVKDCPASLCKYRKATLFVMRKTFLSNMLIRMPKSNNARYWGFGRVVVSEFVLNWFTLAFAAI